MSFTEDSNYFYGIWSLGHTGSTLILRVLQHCTLCVPPHFFVGENAREPPLSHTNWRSWGVPAGVSVTEVVLARARGPSRARSRGSKPRGGWFRGGKRRLWRKRSYNRID